MDYDGLLLIDKPIGWTSFDVVAKIRSLLRQKAKAQSLKQDASTGNSEKLLTSNFQLSTPLPKVKVGHTGTLDPLASGLMLVVLGSYCKRAQEFSKLDKTYEVTMKLGETSTTGDDEGEKHLGGNKVPTHDEASLAIKKFTGEIEQIPPIYSAVKVNGHRAYALARAGKEVVLAPRLVTVHGAELTNYQYPLVSFTASVSSGTYIRSLVVDIGNALETGAYMNQLRRTTVGEYDVQNALEINDDLAANLQGAILKP